jgi:KipI family sensor histidine kinase inhibitor
VLDLPDLDTVHRHYRAIKAADIAEDVVPGLRSLLVIPRGSVGELMAALRRMPEPATSNEPPEVVADIEIPVVYDGVDLAAIAEITCMDVEEVIKRHTAVDYTVAFVGLARAFPYLLGTDESLHVPRLATPRSRVASGSIAIAGELTGIYPMDSPGGWRLLGHTDATLFDPLRCPPALLEPGTRVRLVRREVCQS